MATLKVGSFVLAVMLSISGCNADNKSTHASQPSQVLPASSPEPQLITSAIASPDRLQGDSDEDAWRLPDQVLSFAGVKPGMHVLDYFAASGYYSELLARAVGPSGSVIVYNNRPYAEFAGEKLTQRFANHRLPNAVVVTAPTEEFKPDANSLDVVLFVMSYHDLYWKPKDEPTPLGNPIQVLQALFSAVKPGGVVVVVDHAASAGGDTARVVDALHRIDPVVVKNDFSKAGFVFETESKALAHADDDHTKPVFDPAVRHKTDQFIYRFRKPAK